MPPPGEPEDHALGRSRGEYGTKLRMVCDRTMLPLGFVLTPDQQHEATVVPDLVLSMPRPELRLPAKVAGDKGYRSPAIREFLSACGSEPVIPHSRDELARMPKPPKFDRRAYRRRFGIRFEKLAVNFATMVRIALIHLYRIVCIVSSRRSGLVIRAKIADLPIPPSTESARVQRFPKKQPSLLAVSIVLVVAERRRELAARLP